jgi:enoyl-CoA hydratase/carnithine racemase/3-hydroxyacyl-CoA dehydrogenase
MQPISDPAIRAIFQPDPGAPPKALLVAGACGNVGYGKLGQLARLLTAHGITAIALDLAPAVHGLNDRLASDLQGRFTPAEIASVTDKILTVQGTLDDLPQAQPIGLCFEAIPERLDLKRAFYQRLRARDPEAYIFSATSGLTTRKLFDGLPGAERCGVLHPFFPHLTNKLWEMPIADAVTGAAEVKAVRRLLDRLGMTLIPVRDVAAFAADRYFCGMMLEAVRIHADLGLSPAQVDDVCRQVLGTSPFLVHNLIRGANGLSAHCMELMSEEVPSNLFEIPAAWRPYLADPALQWPYERGQRCPPELFEPARARLLGMLFALTAAMIDRQIAGLDALNYLAEKALAFREGPPALIQSLGAAAAAQITRTFLEAQQITHADQVAPLAALDPANNPGWGQIYVGVSVQDGVGLISLKRSTLSHTFIAELDAAYERLAADPTVAAIVIAPDGHFSREFGHGADLNAFVPVLGDHAAALALIQRWKTTLNKLRRGKPTVAALVGRVLGGGLELATSCHARIAAAGTVLAQPEVTVGVLPGLGGCHQIHRASDPAAAPRVNQLLLTGHPFPAEEAATWGFISAIVPVRDLPRASFDLARAFAQGAALPPFRAGPHPIQVDRGVDPRNERGVPLDADLRDLLAATIEATNNLDYPAASEHEADRAAHSLTQSASKIGVTAMLRGKPPTFARPLA